MTESERARSALHSLDPGCDREPWIKAGMAAKAAGLSLDDFTDWSRGAPNFAGERDCAQVWRSFTDGGIKAGTLFSMAFSAGWNDPEKRRQNQPGQRQNERPKQSPQKAEKSALSLWNRLESASPSHPYIMAKKGKPDGLRVVPDGESLTIAGQSVAGYLAVPAFSIDGTLRTLQLIPGQGKKLNLPGHSFDDGLFLVGDIATSGRVFIVEEIGQAWACNRSTGCAAVVSFGAGRLEKITGILRREYPQSRLVLVPDRGKEIQASEIAKQHKTEWVTLPDQKPANYDAADLAAEYSDEALSEILEQSKRPPMRYRLLTAADIVDRPPLRWMVRGVLPAEGIAALYGPSASGKSFLALDLAAAIADGAEWFGCRVKQASVVYAALEGEAGFSQRAKAWQLHHGQDLPDFLQFIMQPLDLRTDDVTELADAVIASGRAGGLLVIDTLNRAASGADENSSQDMGQIIDACKALQAKLGGLVMLIHHSGKDATKGLRGHSSLYAALDAAIEVRRDGDSREWCIAKAKDGNDSAAHPFRLEVVEIGEHDDGEPITSCAVVREESAAIATRRKIPKGGNQRIVWDALGDLLKKSRDFGKGGAPGIRPCVELEAAIIEIAPSLTCEEKRKPERTRQAITGLVASKTIEHREGWLWIP
ncbi:MAG: AAA family ATPase [Pseudomonadota bacterium]|nr:AAA family ATPase [Pseudomonadota bacterium]